jgi:predicted PurR-regulated permease PerM
MAGDTDTPDTQSAGTHGRHKTADASIIILAVMAAAVVLSLGHTILAPLTLAIVLSCALYPLMRRLERRGVPTAASATIVVLASLTVLLLLGMLLERPLRDMATDVPQSIAKARTKIDALTARLRGLSGTPGQPAGTARPDSAGAGKKSAPAQQAPASTNATPASSGASSPTGILGPMFGMTTSFIAATVEVILLVLFMLAAGRNWMAKLAHMARTPRQKRLWPEIAGEMHDVVSRYLFVTMLINLGQGFVIGLATWAVGLPAPLLWGMLTFVAEWVPYLGGLTMVVLLLVVGLASSQSFVHALIAPIIYLAVTTLQNNLVSPVAYGKGLRLNPTAILFAVMLWYLLWGTLGAFLAVPILASLRVLGTRVKPLEPLAILLED